MHYRNYIGSVELSEADSTFFGRVQGIRALISYDGNTAEDLIANFHAAIDDYLTTCETAGVLPEISYKGSFNVRIDPELHRQAAVYAIAHQQTLNSFVEEAIREKLGTANSG